MRKLFLILYLSLLSICSFGQIQMMLAGSETAPGVTYLLDEYTGAAGAYATVNLTSAWVGVDVVEVRRSSDDAVLGFTMEECDDGTLVAWVGGGNNGFVRTVYDQSGNGRNATNTDNATQPKIVISGSLVTQNGHSAIYFDGDGDYLNAPNTLYSVSQQYVNAFSVYSLAAGGNFPTLIGTLASGKAFLQLHNGSTRETRLATVRTALSAANGSVLTLGATYLTSSFANRTNINLFLNGVSNISAADTDTNYQAFTSVRIGGSGGAGTIGALNGEISAVVFYTTDQSANRTAIETIINDIYSIY